MGACNFDYMRHGKKVYIGIYRAWVFGSKGRLSECVETGDVK